MTPRVSRRTLLRTGTTATALGLLGSLAGCQNPLGGSSGDGRAHIDIVPQGAAAVVDMDTAALLSDSGLREQVNSLLSEAGGPDSVEAALDRIQTDVGLDPRGLQEVLAFRSFDGPEPQGTVIWTEWTQSELFGVFRERGAGASETTYGGKTILETETTARGLALGALGDGTFVGGTPGTVRSVVDRWQGDGTAVEGEPRTAYSSAGEGYVRFGFDVPTDRIPDRSGQAMNPGVLRQAKYGYGSLSAEKVLEVSLEAESESAAEEIRSLFVAAKTMARQQLNGTAASTPRQQQLGRILDDTAVSRDQQTVTIRNESGGETLVLVLGGVVGTFVLGLGSQPQQAQSAPQVAFEAEYDAETQELTIVHTAGDYVTAGELFVRGENVPTGRWDSLGGSASGDQNGRPAVAAGDRLTLSEVPPDYRVRIVWQPSEGDRSMTLFQADGPEA